MDNYLSILEEGLKKKLEVLKEIEEYNCKQEELLKSEQFTMEELDQNMERKDELIQKLEALDEGFEALYYRIKDQLLQNQDQYRAQIQRIQQLITDITGKGIAIQTEEARNKKRIEDYFAEERSKLARNRQTSKAAYDYYRSVNGVQLRADSILDQKK